MGVDAIPSCPLLVWCNVHRDDWSSRWLQPLEKWRDRATQAAPRLSISICFSLGGITVWMWFWQSDLCNLIPRNMETNNALSVSLLNSAVCFSNTQYWMRATSSIVNQVKVRHACVPVRVVHLFARFELLWDHLGSCSSGVVALYGSFSLDTCAHSKSIPILTYIWSLAPRFQTLVTVLRGFIKRN